MRTILFVLTLLAFRTDFGSGSSPLIKIFAKHYCLTYSDESRPFVAYDSVGMLTKREGVIKRNDNYIVAKSDSIIGMLEDTTCFYMDNGHKMMTVGPKSSIGTFLIQPLSDPYEIINYAINNKMGFQKYAAEGKMIYEFIGVKQNDLIFNIVVSFQDDKSDSFSIKLVYQQYPLVKQDIINYKFVLPSEQDQNMISNFLDFKNGRYQPKDRYSHYFFVNTFLVQRMK